MQVHGGRTIDDEQVVKNAPSVMQIIEVMWIMVIITAIVITNNNIIDCVIKNVQ